VIGGLEIDVDKANCFDSECSVYPEVGISASFGAKELEVSERKQIEGGD
jgi:hypothetical protein